MTSRLDSLAGPSGSIVAEPPDRLEFEGLKKSGLEQLRDAGNAGLGLQSRFVLAYGASHALSLAALRAAGYRPRHRYIVFQVLPTTLGLGPEVWRILSKAHDLRNLGEYEGSLDVDERLVTDLVAAVEIVAEAIRSVTVA